MILHEKPHKFLQEIFIRVIYILLGIFLGTLIAYFESDIIFYILIEPLEKTFLSEFKIIFLGITEGFISQIKVVLLVGIFFSLPLFWIQILFFISPALYYNELKFFFLLISISSGFLFITFFMLKDYFLPRIWSFFLSFQGDISYYPSLVPYLETFMEIFAGFLLSSQIPIFLYLFVHWGWLNKNFLVKNRRSFILLILLWGALITPPDLLSLIFVFFPLIFLYEFFVWNVFIVEAIKNK